VTAALGLAAVALGVSLLSPGVFGPMAGDRWRDAQAGAVSVFWPLRRAWPAIAAGGAAVALAALAGRRTLLTRGIAGLVVLDLGLFTATALGPQWRDGLRDAGAAIPRAGDAAPKDHRTYVVTSPEPWRGASNRALTDGYSGLDLYVSLPLRRHVDYMQAFWLSDQTAAGLLQAASVGTVVDGWRRPLDPRSRLLDEEWSPRWPLAMLGPGERVRYDVTGLRADSVRLVTALQGAGARPGEVVARVLLQDDHGTATSLDLRAGVETAERHHDSNEREETRSPSVAGWSRVDESSEGRFYLARHDWGTPHTAAAVEIEYFAPQGHLLLFGGSLRGSSAALALTPFMAAPYRRRDERDGAVLYDLGGARPRATAVHHVVRVANAKAAIQRLAAAGLDAPDTVALETQDSPAPAGTGPSLVSVVADQPLRVELTAQMHGSGYVVLADAYYPGWVAEIDGSPTTVYPADGLFRAVFVPDGTHQVVWRYEPRWLRMGLAITAATLAAAALLLLRSFRGAEAARSGSRS
jgi:hypothetical protein